MTSRDLQNKTEVQATRRRIPTASKVLDDGRIIETVYEPKERRTRFVVWRDGTWEYAESVPVGGQHELVPYSPYNNLIRNGAVLLPSGVDEYGTTEELVRDVQSFIHSYVDVSERFEKIAAYYVLFSWIYDCFNEVPYLRLRGDFGSGKTRFLLTVGALCYKPFYASGAASISPVFRTLDAFRGTLIIDEADFRYSDQTNELIKVLNCGNQAGTPVLRSEVVGNKEYNPKSYAVYGPKVLAMRGSFVDQALESRCITEQMQPHRLRRDIPINLPARHKAESEALRNKLLLFRFRNFGKKVAMAELVDASLEPRANQIFVPLMSIVESDELRRELKEVAREYNRELVMDRSMAIEGQVLEVIRALWAQSGNGSLRIKDVTARFLKNHGNDYQKPVSNQMIGMVVRKKLGIKTVKSHGTYGVPWTEQTKLEQLYEKYGILGPEDANSEERVDQGETGDTLEQAGSMEAGENKAINSAVLEK